MEKLSPAEEEVMQAIWHTGGGFIRDFVSAMKAPPAYTTVASTVKNLERKGFVRSKRMANSYWYQPAISIEAYQRNHFSHIAKDYFSNSYKEMVSFFAQEQKISPEELKEIIAMIEQKK
ncbi:BlaI/MecI/CopY family transcriptional regulator [Taibaiella koreensis]|uniref:BlaI/MecI/CopY family transcriptional regulator n=1 Tax=Taibaiella koreensis TaxID=1268548 RepID=UPI000E59E404|nr:BlaI/MecI/CopY family transcriptional regulator [Taibaiella koreensis]